MKSDHKSKTVVLVSNLGTPNQPTEHDVRVYLKEFLSDKDVIRLPRIFRLPLLHLIILRTRPKKSNRRRLIRHRREKALRSISRIWRKSQSHHHRRCRS